MRSVNGYKDSPYNILPEHMRDGMRMYIEVGMPCGDFLRCVLSNDLMGALSYADSINMHEIHKYGFFLYNYAPAMCYGSKENYDSWVMMQGMINKEREAANA